MHACMPAIIKLRLYVIMQLVRIIHCGNTVSGLERGVAACEWSRLTFEKLEPATQSKRSSSRHVTTEASSRTVITEARSVRSSRELISFFCF